MIISYNFGIDLMEYAKRGTSNCFPLFNECPNCKCFAPGNVHRNGYYWRNGITEEIIERIPICRFRCLACGVNISVLPDFLIPYFQYTIHTILTCLGSVLEKKKVNQGRQLLRFHLKRFIKNFNWIHSFLSDTGKVFSISGDLKEKATKYMKMILDFGESPFLRRSWGHLSKYFMAN